MSAITPSAGRWLFGPTLDLALGCGLAYAGVFALLAAVGSDTLSGLVPAGIVVMLAAIPHYGATLLRVYESPADRHRYRIFSVWTTVALAALFVFGLRDPWVGSVVLTVYLTWSPWHYTGQNYGLALMQLGRRGVTVTPLAKRLLYASFGFSFLLTFLAIHGAERSSNYAPVSYQDSVFHLIPLGLPHSLVAWLLPLVALATAISAVTAVAMIKRAGRWRDLVPLLALLGLQSLWFTFPVGIRYWQLGGGSLAFDQVYTPYGFIWIAFAHAVQYLWVTSFYARAAGTAKTIPRYLGKAALAGYAVWTLPALLFAPGLLGDLPYESGLALQVAAIVNLHHFVLDGAIWKLRDRRVGRLLLRDPPTTPERPADVASDTRGRRWPWRTLLWAAGGCAVAVAVAAAWENSVGSQRALARGDVARVRTASERLAWLGRDGPAIHREIGKTLARRRELKGAEIALRRSLELGATNEVRLELAKVLEARAMPEASLAVLDEVLREEPDRVDALFRRGTMLLALQRAPEAVESLERAAQLAPDRPRLQLTLERARREASAVPSPPVR